MLMHKNGGSKGAALLEYGLLVGLVSVVALGAVAANGQKVSQIFSTVAYETSDAMAGHDPEGRSEEVTSPRPAFECGANDVEIAGQSYSTTVIGDQCWLAENLNVPEAGGRCYNDDPNSCNTYGRLYSATNVEVLDPYCPTGWRIARDEDWMELERALGMSETEVVATGWRTSGNVEEQISAFVSGGTDSAGFNANLGGYTYTGTSIYRGERGLYLSGEVGHTRVLRSDVEGVNRYDMAASGNADETTGFARCVSFDF